MGKLPDKQTSVRAALKTLKGAGWAIGIISGTVNLLALTGAFYMLQVYDRVLLSRSVPTLIALSVLALGLYIFQGALEIARSQLLVRIGSRVDRNLTVAGFKNGEAVVSESFFIQMTQFFVVFDD